MQKAKFDKIVQELAEIGDRLLALVNEENEEEILTAIAEINNAKETIEELDW